MTDKILNMHQDLFFNLTAVIRVEKLFSDNVVLEIRQGESFLPISSPSSEMITRSIVEENVRVNRNNHNNIRYADDTVLGTNGKDLHKLLNVINENGQKFNMEMNSNETEVPVIRKNQNVQANIPLKNKALKQVFAFQYLASTLTEVGRSQREILITVAEAKQPFQKTNSVPLYLKITICKRFGILKCYIEPFFVRL